MAIVKWTNKFSGETGYIASVSTKNKSFINTFEKSEAKEYSDKYVKNVLSKMEEYGETENNDFEVISE